MLPFRKIGRSDDLRACSEHNAAGLRIGAVSCVAGSVEEVRPVGVIPDGGPAIIAAVGVGFGELEVAVTINLCDRAIGVLANWIGWIDYARRIRVRNIDGVDGHDITHEGEITTVGGQVESQLRFR